MKKLWYLLPALILTLGVVACGEDDTETDPTPPPGPTEEITPPAVQDLVVEPGLNEATLSWTLPSDQTNVKKIKIGVKISGENSIDWMIVDQVCSSYTVTDLDEPSYYFEVRTVNDKKESVGATSDLVDIYSLDAFRAPAFELYEDEVGWTLKATNLSTSTSVFHSIKWSIVDTRAATVCEGEYTASAEELANVANKKSTITEMEWITEYEFDDEGDYEIAYEITVYPALGGALNTADNIYYYEGGILEQSVEMEQSVADVVTQLIPDPLVIHFWGGDSPNVLYETVAFAWDAPFGVEKYLIYYGADYETATVVEVEKGSENLVDAHGVSASAPTGEYAKVWNADKAYIINEMASSPAYIRVEAIDLYERVMAMGQYYTYNFTVRADQEDIQDHQPKFSIEYQTEGDYQYQWKVAAKHISAARAYAKIFSWKAIAGGEVVAEGTCHPDAFSVGYKTEPQLREHAWYFDETKFEANTKYTFEYEITYVPVSNSYERGDVSPLDYNPETKEFTPAADVDKPTGITHDPRILQPIITDNDGHIKYRTRVGEDDKVYTYYDEECRYITLSHCNYEHSRKEIIIKSSDIAAANSEISFDVVSSEKPDDITLDLNVKTEIDDGTERKSTEGGHRGVRSINGLYESARVIWNHPASVGIESIIISYGSEEVVLTADNWTVAEGKGVYTITGLKTHPATIKVTAMKGNEELASDSVDSDVYTISDVDVEFEVKRNDDGSWAINAYGIAGESFSFYSLSFNLYKNGIAVFDENITKNGDNSINSTLETWITNRGASSYIEVNNGDWDGDAYDKIPGNKLAYDTEYEVRYELTAYPVIYDPVADAEDFHKNPEWFYYSRINTTPQSVGEKVTTVTTPQRDDTSALNLTADIDEGTTRIDTQYPTYVGLKSINGLFQAARLSWDQPESGVTSVEIKYGTETITLSVADLTVENGRASYVVEDLTESAYDFAVTLYNGEESIATEAVSTDIYTLPSQSSVTFNVVYDNDKQGWIINIPTGLSTKYYATWVVSFNVYEQGSTTPVFTNSVTKNGKEDIITFKKWMARSYVDYHMTNCDWDADCTPEFADKLFTGLKFSTNYDIEYTLQVYPMIYDAQHAKNSATCFGHKRMLMNSEATNGAYTYSGKVSILTEAQPSEQQVIGLKFSGHAPKWQTFGAQITPVNAATRYEVYYGDYTEGVKLGTLRTAEQVENAISKASSTLTKFDTFETTSDGKIEFYAPSTYWPTYMMAVGYDADGKVVAAGQMNCYNYTLSADNKMLQHHQPKFAIDWDIERGQWKVTASHISSALGYATKIKWNIDGTNASGEYETDVVYNSDATPALKSHDWFVAGDALNSNTTYTFSYEITYAPTSNKWYDPSGAWSGDFRDMRMCEMDGDLYKCATTGNYMSRDENCNYVYAMASYGKGHAPLKGHPTLPDHLVTISSSQLPATALHNTATTGEKLDYALALAADIDDGTDWVSRVDNSRIGRKSINGLYQAVRLSWVDNPDIASVTVAYDGQSTSYSKSDFTVKEGRASVEVQNLTKTYYDFTVTTTVGGKSYSESVGSDVYTLEGVNAPKFKLFYDDRDGYKKNNVRVDGWAGKQNFFYSFKFQFYKDGKPVFEKWIEKKFATETQFLIPWASYSGITWLGDDNFDDFNQYIKGLELDVMYDVEYEMTAWPTIHDPELTATKNNNGFYFKKILMEPHTVKGTARTFIPIT